MDNVQKIIECLDKWLETNGETSLTPPQANAILEREGILKNSNARRGLPLREILRDGLIPHAYKDGKYWIIPHSKSANESAGGITKSNAILQDFNQIINSINRETSKSNSKLDINSRTDSDEYYVVSLCNNVLGRIASQQHKFDFLVGDTGRKLPVDAYYKDINLVVEYYERQHTESVKFFDKKKTVSGVSRGEQRRIYDERRKTELPKHGIKLVVIQYSDFGNSKKLKRNYTADLQVVKRIFQENGIL